MCRSSLDVKIALHVKAFFIGPYAVARESVAVACAVPARHAGCAHPLRPLRRPDVDRAGGSSPAPARDTLPRAGRRVSRPGAARRTCGNTVSGTPRALACRFPRTPRRPAPRANAERRRVVRAVVCVLAPFLSVELRPSHQRRALPLSMMLRRNSGKAVCRDRCCCRAAVTLRRRPTLGTARC
jgi:hypothetical protein